MPGAAAEYLFPHGLAPSEKHQVEFFVQQGGVFRPASRDHRHIFLRKKAPQQPGNGGAGSGGIGAGLDDGGVACGNGIRQRLQGQKQRIVPGADDQGVSIGHGLPAAPGRKLGQGSAHSFGLGKGAEVAHQIADLRQQQPYLAHIALVAALAQIRFQRLQQCGLIFLHPAAQPFQLGNPELHIQRLPRGKKPALLLGQISNFPLSHIPRLQSSVSPIVA